MASLQRGGPNGRRLALAGVLTFLAIELLDELVFGAREAAWPNVRGDLDLSYAEIGLLLAIPQVVSALSEPAIGLLADAGWRRPLILGGGLALAAGLMGLAAAPSFVVLLLAFAVIYPASGAFVSLSQAELMDLAPERREENMARWGVAGGIGAVAGPLLLAGAVVLDIGWRPVFAAFAVLTLALVGVSARRPAPSRTERSRPDVRGLLRALRRREVLRWLALLELCDLLLDVLLGFVALYFVDEVGSRAGIGGVAVATWTGAGLVGGLVMVALLRRVSGLRYLRASAVLALGLYPAFLLVPGSWPKLVLLGLLGLVTAGWYAVPKARLYGALPGQSGAAVSLSSVTGLVASLPPLAIAALAEAYGLDVALWLLLAAPVALLVAVPRDGG